MALRSSNLTWIECDNNAVKQWYCQQCCEEKYLKDMTNGHCELKIVTNEYRHNPYEIIEQITRTECRAAPRKLQQACDQHL